MSHTMDRRSFLSQCGMVVATTYLAGGIAHGGEAGTGRTVLMIEELTPALFEKHLGARFTAQAEGGEPVALKLVRVLEAPARKPQPGAPRVEGFSIIFEGTPETGLSQGTYTFENPDMGSVALFAVPVVSEEPSVRRYEVIITRLVDG